MNRSDYSGSTRVPIRSTEELNLLRQSGKITAAALKKAIESAKPGISLLDLDSIAEDEIVRLGGRASFKTVPGYDFATCLTVNDEVVHGLPRPIKLETGDVLNIDLGAVFKGWHTDAAWTVVVGGEVDEQKERFLAVGEKALWDAVKKASPNYRIGDLSSAIQQRVEGSGYSVVRSLAGHGVGREPHEEPEIPTYGRSGYGLKLAKGMVLAIEAIYTAGNGEVYQTRDGWTIASSDGSWGGLFEMTVIVGAKGPEVITDWRKM